jgi:type IV pilus assembly protein PilV
MNARGQHGMFLIEALIAILIFSLGVLGMIAMAGAAVSAQSDAQFRTEANGRAEAIASEIALGVNRVGPTASDAAANLSASLAAYRHRETGAPASCSFTGAEATNPRVLALAHAAGTPASGGMPGADITRQQVSIDTAEHNRVTITLCWRAPTDTAWRRHTFVTYVN